MHTKHEVIGIAGTNGSGKDSLGQLLADEHGYLFISLTDMLREELGKRGKSTARENMRELSAEWRRQSGLGVLVDKAYDRYKQVQHNYKGLVVASLRNPGEADSVHELQGVVIWVDADPKVRFDRLSKRGREDDPTSFEQFLEDEKAEMQHSGDEATLSTAAVQAKSDMTLQNNGSTLEDLKQTISKLLSN